MILQLAVIIGVILLYFFLYYAVGSVANRCLLTTASLSFPRTLILGFFVYYFLFSVVALPMKVTLQPLSRLSLVWGCLLILITILFLILERNQWRRKLTVYREAFSGKQKYIFFVFFALIAVQVILVNLNDETYAIWDQSYYLGDTATSLYTNTISQYDPYTGKILDHLNSEYLLETYQNHSAVMCQILHLHPMVENLTVMATVVVILYQLIAWEIGLFLFHGSRAKSVLLTAFLALLNFFSFNLYTAAEFLFIRPSEGKTILAVLIIPTLLYLFLETAADHRSRTWWTSSFLVILGSFGLNMSSIFMIPFEISVLYLPLALREKKFSIVIRYLLLLLPCAVMAILYLLTKNKYLIYTS